VLPDDHSQLRLAFGLEAEQTQTQPAMMGDDKPHEECGVFGVYAPGRDVARLSFFGLYALQHRGQEAAGIATSDGSSAHIHKDMGLVSQVFNEMNLAPLVGTHAIAHNRYSTTGSSQLRNTQPFLLETIDGPLGVAHNGNLTNTLELRKMILERGAGLSSTSDSEVITMMLAAPVGAWALASPDSSLDRWQQRLRGFMHVAQGAYSLAVLTRDAIYGARDPNGLRPLCLGSLSDGHWVLASETSALMTIGAKFVRDIQPGEIIKIDANGISSIHLEMSAPRALCSFEYVYFARPDSLLEGQVIHDVRQKLGRELAKESPSDADIVIAVPDSATPHAIGYAIESGIPYTEGLIKNRYIGRTFIQPDQSLREIGMQLKYNPLSANLEGKRVVLVDDSIVRGTTSGPLVQLVRAAGAREVHVRVASPMIKHPCFMGVDMATYKQLIAHNKTLEEICAHIGADSLAYLSIEGMHTAISESAEENAGHCNACFSGKYPINIPEWLFTDKRDKMLFEGSLA
jgi:amidophosphoribosyltransferase